MSISNRRGRASARRGAPLIVHSHLRWDFVWQRPQQILTRLAEQAPVFFLEEPVFSDDVRESVLDVTVPHANVYRAVPRLPARLREDYDGAVAEVRSLALAELNRSSGRDNRIASTGAPHSSTLGELFRDPVQWFYTPMPAPAMLGAFREAGVVYDCMDELSQFRFAHPDLLRRERLLLAHADVVFTGGYKLRQSKAKHHDNVHYFGCGVDADHFAKARDSRTAVAADIAQLTGPVAGYYGVIDERLDYGLIAKLAATYPAMHVVMVGPVVKVSPAELPKAPNIHWLGSRPYDALPSYVRRYDVCLMPFALNGATEYINPTKTLEYMAAGKPIVSTAVADVVHNFAPVVNVATTPTEFVRAVMSDVRQPDASFITEGIAMARDASWESIVSSMNALVLKALSAQAAAPKINTERIVERAHGRAHDRAHERGLERATDRSAERVPEMGVAAVSRASA